MRALLKHSRIVLAALGLLLLTLAMVEILARIRYGPPFDSDRFFQYDPRMGWVNVPGIEGRFLGMEFRTRVRFNSAGMRGLEREQEKAPGVYRIMVLGDSFAAGMEVSEEQTWAALLEQELNRQFGGTPQVEVLNAGVRGYGTDQALQWLVTKGLDYQPDLVLYAVSANDVFNNGTIHRAKRRYGKPYYELEGETLLLRGVPVPEYPYNLEWFSGSPPVMLGDPHEQPPGRAETFFRQYSAAWAMFERAQLGRAIKRQPPLDLRYTEWGVYLREYPPEWQARQRLTEALLAQMQRASAAHGARMAVVLMVEREMVMLELMEETLRSRGVTPESVDVTKVDQLLAEASVEHGFVYLSPLRDVRNAGGADGRFWFRMDAHFNPSGHRQIADFLARNLPAAGPMGRTLTPAP